MFRVFSLSLSTLLDADQWRWIIHTINNMVNVCRILLHKSVNYPNISKVLLCEPVSAKKCASSCNEFAFEFHKRNFSFQFSYDRYAYWSLMRFRVVSWRHDKTNWGSPISWTVLESKHEGSSHWYINFFLHLITIFHF